MGARNKKCPCRDSSGRPKRQYEDFDHVIDGALRNSMRHGIPMRPYPCPNVDDLWHLTTLSQEEYEKRKEERRSRKLG